MSDNIIKEQRRMNKTILLVLTIGISAYIFLYFYLLNLREEPINGYKLLITILMSVNSLNNLWAFFVEKAMWFPGFKVELDQPVTRIAFFIYSLIFLALSLAIVYYEPVIKSV